MLRARGEVAGFLSSCEPIACQYIHDAWPCLNALATQVFYPVQQLTNINPRDVEIRAITGIVPTASIPVSCADAGVCGAIPTSQ